eukprot:jgi/Hompol1/290/HPOL_005290-RA
MYVPLYRSGAYAILVALHRHAPISGYMSKHDIISAGQQYTDTSFAIPSTNTGFARTAWGSMSTLVKKELVYRTGMPHKFCLTEEGRALAERLTLLTTSPAVQHVAHHAEYHSELSSEISEISEDADMLDLFSSQQSDLSVSNAPSFDTPPEVPFASSFVTGLLNRTANRARDAASQAHMTGATKRFAFEYVDCDGHAVVHRELSEVKVIESTGSLGYRIRFDRKSAPDAFMQHVECDLAASTVTGLLEGYLSEDFAPQQLGTHLRSYEIVDHATSKIRTHQPLDSRVHQHASVSRNTPLLPLNSGMSIQDCHAAANLIRFPKGSFDVFLVLDSREVVKKTQRQFFQTELEQLGVKVLTRSLALGDFIWIAKRKAATQHASLFDDEIVLDTVVERKLLDDLIASIKDDRFKEQKFRLSSCGLQNVVYLVEEVMSADAVGFGYDKIFAAMTQTQVLEGFSLKRTFSPIETVNYLLSLTRVISATYLNQDLCGLRSTDVTKETLQGMREKLAASRSETILLSFDAYQSINTKTGSYKLQDIWIRQLMCLRGVSAEKAAAITARYPTALSLMQALSAATDRSSKVALFRDLGEGRRAIGASLAQSIADYFDASSY